MTTPTSHARYTKFKIAQKYESVSDPSYQHNTREEEKRGLHPIFQTTVAQLVSDSTTTNCISLKHKNISHIKILLTVLHTTNTSQRSQNNQRITIFVSIWFVS
jgi:hypothetical protein